MFKKILVVILVIAAVCALATGPFLESEEDTDTKENATVREPATEEDTDTKENATVQEPSTEEGPSDEIPIEMPYSITYGPADVNRIELELGEEDSIVYDSRVQGYTIQKVDTNPAEYTDDNFTICLEVEPNTTYELRWIVAGNVASLAPVYSCVKSFGYTFGEPKPSTSDWQGYTQLYGSNNLCSATITTGDETLLYFYLFEVFSYTDSNICPVVLCGEMHNDIQFVLIKKT